MAVNEQRVEEHTNPVAATEIDKLTASQDVSSTKELEELADGLRLDCLGRYPEHLTFSGEQTMTSHIKIT